MTKEALDNYKEKEDENNNIRNNRDSSTSVSICNSSSTAILDNTDSSTEATKSNVLSIKDEQGNLYEFEKPEFDVKLYEARGKYIFGRVNEMPVVIRPNGNILDSDYIRVGKYLTPIKKEWYEYPENFPALIYHEYRTIHDDYAEQLFVANDYSELQDCVIDSPYSRNVRLATKEEVMSLYYKDRQ